MTVVAIGFGHHGQSICQVNVSQWLCWSPCLQTPNTQ